jgi:antitoxin CptB
MADTADPEYARLKWRCRRGMRELDAVLQAFLATGFADLDDDDKSRFAAILDLPDPELYGYLAGRIEPKDRDLGALIGRIRASLHTQT